MKESAAVSAPNCNKLSLCNMPPELVLVLEWSLSAGPHLDLLPESDPVGCPKHHTLLALHVWVCRLLVGGICSSRLPVSSRLGASV